MRDETYNIDLERTLLASLIFDPALLHTNVSKLNEKLFTLPFHRKVMALLLKLENEDKVIDELILRDKLGASHEDDMLFILSANPITHLDTYLDLLNEYSIKRDIQKLILTVGNDLANNTGQELQAKLFNFTDQLQSNTSSKIFEIENIINIEEKQTEFICSKWLPIPKRTVSLVTAPGGTGKSWLVLQFAIRAVLEKDVKRAFLWLSEDPKDITKHRFNKVYSEILRCKDEWVKEKIDISDSPTIQFLYDEQRKVEVSPLFYKFKMMLDFYDLIILDPLIAFYGTDENNNASARRFMQLFTEWANKENKTIIFIHHSTKNTTQSRGASAFVDAVRVVYELDKIKDKDGKVIESNQREVKLTKDNYGAGQLLDNYIFKRELFPKLIKYEEITYKESSALTNDTTEINTKSFIHSDF